MSFKGIDKKPYLDLESFLDMTTFDNLQPEILRGFAEARDLAKEGTWMRPGFTWDDCSYKLNWLPIPYAIDKFMALDDNDPIKIEGMKMYNNIKDHHTRNLFTRYLKMAVGAYDPYTYYFLWEEGDWNDRTAERKPTPEAAYFPGAVKWVNQMVDDGIFDHIGRVIFFCIEAGGIPFEHRDLDAKNGVDVRYPHRNEFIHIRPNTKKAFYVWDPEKKNKTYLNTRAAWWNDQDWHGGEMTMEPSYALRIDGQFTKEFRERIGVSHLENY